MSYSFDRPSTPFLSVLVIITALGYTLFVHPPIDSWLLAFGYFAAIALGGIGVAALLLRWRWRGKLVPAGFLLFAAFLGVTILMGSIEVLSSHYYLAAEPLQIFGSGIFFAGLWHFFLGPFIIDKSSEARSNKR